MIYQHIERLNLNRLTKRREEIYGNRTKRKTHMKLNCSNKSGSDTIRDNTGIQDRKIFMQEVCDWEDG